MVTSGQWAEAVSSVSLQEWKDAAKMKGVPRIAAGIAAAEPKLQRFYAQLLPYVDQIKGEIDAMPNLTLEDRIARSAQFQRRMNEFHFSRR